MVEITCPHCDGDIELPDGSFGEFECPICGEDFVWEQQPVQVFYSPPKQKGVVSLILNAVALFTGFSLLVTIGFIVGLMIAFYFLLHVLDSMYGGIFA